MIPNQGPTKVSKGRMPSAAALEEGAGAVIQPCRLVPELREAGLGEHELLVEFGWIEDDDEEGGEDSFPAWKFSIRKVGNKRWNAIGVNVEGYSFKNCAGAGGALQCYFNAIEDKVQPRLLHNLGLDR
jgi:hypothetical protein